MNVLVLYASRHGHTRRVAEFVASALSARGWSPDLRDIEADPPRHLDGYRAAVLASPIHVGRHAKRMISFVRRHRRTLEVLPSAFISVSLTQATVESVTENAEKRRQAHEDLSVALGTFIESTGWHPRETLRVAGAMAYTRYNWFVRWIMKRIATAQGGSTDTSRDHVYTNWDALERSVTGFVERLEPKGDASVVAETAKVG